APHHLLENGAPGRLVVDHHHRIARRRQHPYLSLRHDPSPNYGFLSGEPTPGRGPRPAGKTRFSARFFLVPEERPELSWPCGRRILSPLRLPVPPFRLRERNYNSACSFPSSTTRCRPS